MDTVTAIEGESLKIVPRYKVLVFLVTHLETFNAGTRCHLSFLFSEQIVSLIEMSSARSLYHRRPERNAKEKRNFQRLIQKLKQRASERGYTKKQIATELGVSHTCIYQWWNGYSLRAKRKSIERLKEFLSAQ
jgi:DNA-binding XRE family transcriptional regulator